MFDLARIATGLPVGEHLAEFAAALGVPDARLVVQAPPGSGKTTVVPAVAANEHDGRVVVTQPRRIAARAAAHRLAQLTGTRIGDLIGFTVRGESKLSKATRIEFVTTGVLVNRALRDPELPGVGTVILDEVHERRLDADLAFAMVHDIAELRDDLALVAMSATLDASRWAQLLGSGTASAAAQSATATQPATVVTAPVTTAPVITAAGALFPLDIRWAPPPSGVLATHGGHLDRAFAAHMASVCTRAMAEQPVTEQTQRGSDASMLVFVPGARDVDDLVALIAHSPELPRDVPVHGLFGSLPAREQDEILRGGDGPRVIVSTSIAESSLTVPGVRIVVDAGLSREPRLDAGRGVTGLVTVRESRASAEQRAGRAARLGPGTAIRCFARNDWAGMAADATPEASVSDLTGAVLTLACWGSARGAGLTLPDPLPLDGVERAIDTLQGIGALGADERATALGRELAQLPVDPRLGRALLEGAPRVGTARAARIVAMLAGDQRAPGGDVAALWRSLNHGNSPGARGWKQEADRLARMVSARSDESSGHHMSDTDALGLVAALARPDWIAHRRGKGERAYLTASGTGVELPRESSAGNAEWLAITELTRTDGRAADARSQFFEGSLVRGAIAISEELTLQAGAGLLSVREQATWGPDTGRISTRRERALGAIVLTSTPVRTPAALALTTAMAALPEAGLGLQSRGTQSPGLLRWSPPASGLRNRLAFLHQVKPDSWPDMSAEALLSTVDTWLTPALRKALGKGGSTFDAELCAALRSLLDWRQAAELDTAAPERLQVPSGSHVLVRYPAPEAGETKPVLAVKLQECFGLRRTPRIYGVPVLMELLSPARRPLAITDDLESFWVNVYPQVRAENRRRYAKHPWPDNPLDAPPRKGTSRSGR